jgi:very-short-patch-repair endonuclease
MFCSNQKLCDNENCSICFEKSFANHEKSIFWSEKNNLKPRQIFMKTHKKYIFDCNYCNKDYISAISNITNAKRWCSCQVNKTNTKIKEILEPLFPKIISEYKVEWCKNITFLPFDFCIEEYKIIVELDGEQHFSQVSNWKSPEFVQARDRYKEACALANGYTIIRLLQIDVYKDKYDWLKELLENIELLRTKSTDKKILYMCKNNEYQKIQQK